jgi:hypothetical protein
MKEKENIVNILKQLSAQIKEEINNASSKQQIRPEDEVCRRWKVDKFKYTEKGVEECTSHSEYITKKSWFRASIKIVESIKKLDVHASATKLITKALGQKSKAERYLQSFTGKLISRYLEEPKLGDIEVDIWIENFLKDIDGEPLKYGARVELDGIIILPKSIDLRIGDTTVLLRQTRVEDIEKEFPMYGFAMQPLFIAPSAVLEIEFLGRESREIQIKVEQSIAVLRLFKVGSIIYTSYRMHSESITDVMASATLGSGGFPRALEKSLMGKEDAQRLKIFWQKMIKYLPTSFYDIGETKLDYIAIAYKRYCDGLLQNGVFERRIANAVMGLESLFLKGDEAQELSYRLRLRIAKVLVIIGYDSYKVKGLVGDAYRVRSLFVHGAHLSYKEKRKLNSKYGDTKTFLLSLLDYLRISILINIFSKKEKEEFLDLIDDSFIEKEREGRLNNLLNSAKSFICME